MYPYGESGFVFREDDGESLDYMSKQSCKTLIECSEKNGNVQITIGERQGEYQNKPSTRIWEVYVHGSFGKVEVNCLSKNDKFSVAEAN